MKNKRKRRKVLSVIKHPNPILRAENAVVEKHGEYYDLALDMIHTMKIVGGIGLAAPQIGKNIQLVVASIDKKPLVLVNPRILNGSVGGETGGEGCLSIPGEVIDVPRPTWIEVEYEDLRGRKHLRTFEDLNCIVVCHEIDHLDGFLIIDYADMITSPISED